MSDSKRFTEDEIREYWESQAKMHGLSSDASWSDKWAMQMEIREILSRVQDGELILDVGCANGFSTLRLACERSVTIKGVDYIEEMISAARRAASAVGPSLRGRVSFDVGNILELAEPSGIYDHVLVTRVLINLGSQDRQVSALEECARVLKPGGTLILSEASLQGSQNLNRLRREWGLEDIPMPPFNLYLDEEKLFARIAGALTVRAVVPFSSSYYVATRVLKPLMVLVAPVRVDPAKPDMEWNRFASQLPAVGDYGTQKLFVLEKS